MSKDSFEWDAEKDSANQQKHGISFTDAQYAFADPHRVIAKDLTHSSRKEERFYCFGKVREDIVTVRLSTPYYSYIRRRLLEKR